MNPCPCFFAGPYTPPACIPWPKNEHEAHVVGVIWLVTWAAGLMGMFLEARRAKPGRAAMEEKARHILEQENPGA